VSGGRIVSQHRQYVVYVIRPSATRPGKTDKITIHPLTGKAHDAHDPAIWMSYTDAQAVVASGIGHGVGLTFTEQDNLFFVDIDNALQLDGTWSPLATQLCRYFAGCYIETSSSGNGLHIIGSLSTPPSEHRTRDIHNSGLEYYTSKRFCALVNGTGSMSHIADQQINWLTENYFPVGSSVQPSDWTTTHDPAYHGPLDDPTLITRMLTSRGNPFSAAIPLADLWAGICDPDGQSEADAALVSHLSFWTGRDCDRIDRLFRQSGLMRDKWDRSAGGGRTYGQLTISKFGKSSTAVYGEHLADEPATGPTVLPPTEAPALRPDEPAGEYRGGGQILTITGQQQHFRGCVYVTSDHGVFCPTGEILDQGRFRVMYGGYEFMVEEGNSKGTKNAWEAFTESRTFTFPKVASTCFRPECAPGAVITEQGRRMVNTYMPVITEIKPGDPSRFLSHLAQMLPDPDDYAIMLAYMAAVVQYPGVKFQWAPLLIGMEGNGKSMLSTVLSHCIGDRYVDLPNAQDIDNKFNSWLQGKLLIGIEEVYTNDRSSLIEALKPMITNKRIGFQGKGANQITGDNRANFILFSNHKDAIRKTGTDRRYAIFYTGQQEVGDLERDGMSGSYFPELYDWLFAGGNAVVNHYLRGYAIPDALNPATSCQRAPRTSSTDEAMVASLGVVEQTIVEMIAQGSAGFAGGFVSSSALSRLFDGRKNISPNKYKEIMKSLGYVLTQALPDGRVHNSLPEGGKPRLYVRSDGLLAQVTSASDITRRYLDAQTGASVAGQAWGQSGTG
jgi:hypothetical protein